MLYAEHILYRLNALGREGAVLRTLDQPLPTDLYDIYNAMLRQCYRRTDTSYHTAVTRLLHWVAFSFRPLTLNEVTSLAKFWTQNEAFDLDDIPEPFAKFIRIGDPGADAKERAQLQAKEAWGAAITELEANKGENQPDAIFDDGGLLVKFRERSLRSFFRESPQRESLYRWTSSQASRQIFLDCVNMARSPRQGAIGTVKSINSFAVDHFMRYWKDIKLEEHSVDEQVEAMEAMVALMMDGDQFPKLVESQAKYYTTRFSSQDFSHLSQWATLLTIVEHKLSKQSCQWWTGVAESPRKCLWHLSKAHAERFFNAADPSSVKAAFAAFRDSFEAVSYPHECYRGN